MGLVPRLGLSDSMFASRQAVTTPVPGPLLLELGHCAGDVAWDAATIRAGSKTNATSAPRLKERQHGDDALFASGLMRKLHLEDRKGTGARQIVLERNFPKMGIGDVQVVTADRETVRPGKL